MWQRILQYCGGEESLTAFLWLLGILVFIVAPISHHFPAFEPVVSITLGLVLIAGIFAAVGSKRLVSLAILLIACAFVSTILKLFFGPTKILLCVGQGASLGAVALYLYLMAYHTMKDGTVSSHRIKGGIAAYLLIGLLWAKIYFLIALADPGSFSGIPQQDTFPTFVYYSFVTLTTLGYGDILPLGDFARSMATAEGLIGQLFPAVFIARLVSLNAAKT